MEEMEIEINGPSLVLYLLLLLSLKYCISNISRDLRKKYYRLETGMKIAMVGFKLFRFQNHFQVPFGLFCFPQTLKIKLVYFKLEIKHATTTRKLCSKNCIIG